MQSVSFPRISAALLLAFGTLAAQTVGGSVSGTVLDPAREPVLASVSATHLETGRVFMSPVGTDGTYRFPALPPGPYELLPSAEQLTAAPVRLQVRVGTSVRLDLHMRLQAVDFRLDVTDSTPLIESRTAAVGAVIERREMRNLPLNQRVFLPLTLLVGGTNASAPGSELSTQHDSGFHVAGAREASNNFLLDGIDNNDLYINRIVVSPPLDTVREFRLHASGYKAEFGRSAGAQINVVSRSGTRQLRGSLYHYLRNDDLDARNFFDPAGLPSPPYRRNQFGSALGGPLPGGKTFFFAGFEGTRIRDAATRTAAVPSQSARDGDLSETGAPVIDPFSGMPFPESRVPLARQSASGRALAAYWPDPNRADPVQNYVSTPLGDGLTNQLAGRLDHDFQSRSAAFVRYNLSHGRVFDPFSDTDVPGFGSFTLDRGQQLAAAYTHPFTPFVLLEARAGFNRLQREVRHQNAGRDIAGELGIPGLSREPRLIGFPSVNVAGFASLSDDTALPILRRSATAHAAASLIRAGPRHSLKLGGEHRRVGIDGFQGLFGRGQFNFLGALSQHPVSDLLLGLPTFSIQTVVDNDFRQRAAFWNGFLQDDWQAAPGLTVSLGLRYEYNAPAFDADDRFMQFDLGMARLVEPGATPLGRAGYAPDRNNFGPRAGIAWAPGDAQVFRAAYGIYYEASVLEANSGLYFNPPYFSLRIFLPSPASLPTLANPFPGEGFAPPASVNALQPDFRVGYAQHWNVGWERALPGGLVARLAYLGSKGSKLLRRRDLNQPPPGPGDPNARRPTPGFANIVLFESAASSIYHSGSFSVERRFQGGLGFRTAYTWAKAIDDVSAFLGSAGDQAFPQNSHDFRAERGLSNFDQRHRLVASAQFETPFRHWLARGWRAYAIATAAGGRPLTPQLSQDNSNTGNSGGIFGADRPLLLADPSLADPSPERFFDRAAFAAAPPLSFGNAGRNILTGPTTASVDLALVRSFRLAENATAEIRVEVFNLANHTNFDLPERTTDLPTFGRILSSGQARQLQLGLRFTF